jgi:hypothetical protein
MDESWILDYLDSDLIDSDELRQLESALEVDGEEITFEDND